MHLIHRPVTQLQGLIVLAIALGGGGVVYGYRHMVIQLAALAVLAINFANVRKFISEAPRALAALLTLTVAIPLLQVVPLPPAVWQALPGRDLVVASYEVAGIPADGWFSFSVDPLRTLTAFCATLAPATLVVVGWSLPQEQRAVLVKTLVVTALVVLALGAVQLSSANSTGLLQRIEPEADVLYGTFSNRNSTGLFFVVVAIMLAALPFGRRGPWLAASATAVAVFVLAVVLTQSRSSMALLAVLLAFVAARGGSAFLQHKRRGGSPLPGRVLGGAAVAMALVIAALTAAALSSDRVAESFERFSQVEDDRLEMWDDGAFVAGRYWPLGAGMGTFDEVFQIDESLEYVSPAKAGRAHNDYVELAIESGAVGLLVLLAWFAWLAIAVWRRWRDEDRWLAVAAHASLVCVALQSVLDYPLRSQALLCTAAVLVVMLLPAKAKEH